MIGISYEIVQGSLRGLLCIRILKRGDLRFKCSVSRRHSITELLETFTTLKFEGQFPFIEFMAKFNTVTENINKQFSFPDRTECDFNH